ncbi:C69 family dipeptidase [Butyricimonas faecihominis]|uniref:dipeptidase n=1 Tax=Butyricimonas faecihominis TaxID=1472416 RepID=UPI0032C1E5BE
MKTLLLILSAILFFLQTGKACTIIVAGKKATVDGSVLNSHTDAGADCRIRVVAGQKFPKGSMAPVYYGIQRVDLPLNDNGEILGYIPQVEQTYTYFQSAYSHINEYQLCIGESTTSQRPELQVNKGEGKQIMTVEQAMIFALQRCKTAEEALTLITSLMEKYGFLPSCGPESECLTIADPEGVWVLELFSVGKNWTPESGKPGVIWAAQRVPDDEIAMIPNWSIIKEIDLSKPEQFRASSNYQQVAIENGWYSPASGKPFVWQDVYAPTPREWATNRFWLFVNTFAPSLDPIPSRRTNNPFDNLNQYIQYVEPLSVYPFSFKPEQKVSVKDFMDFQRSTFSGTIYDKENDAVWYYPDKNGNMVKSKLATPFPSSETQKLMKTTRRRLVARVDGEYGMVAQLRSDLPREIGGIYWVFQDNAYTSPYLPIFTGVTRIPEVYSTYNPKEYSDNSARWAIDFVDNLLYLNWQDGKKDLEAARAPMEQSFFERNAEIEKEFIALQKKNPKKATELLNKYTQECADTIMQTYVQLRNTLITKYTNNKMR